VSGAVLAAASGVGFGVFQAVNVRAMRSGRADPFASMFVQVTIAAVLLVAVTAASGDLLDAFDAPLWALADFALAGLVHFLGGWSLLNLSQKRIGAARTSPLLTTAPVFGVALALITPGQVPGAVTLGAIALMVAGAYVVAARGGLDAVGLSDALPGLGCAFMWALSPIFIVHGLDGFHSALAGLAVGLLVCVAACALVYAIGRGGQMTLAGVAGAGMSLKLLAGLLVALATWWRWAALEDVTVGAVLALSLLSVPVVLFLAPVIAGRHVENVTLGLWAGAGLVVSGALILVVA
jgi:drug/metabolite transporter (DMT)-like permease